VFINWKIKFSIGFQEHLSAPEINPVGETNLLPKPPYGRCRKTNFLKPVST